jgi:hypothetical protein
VGNRDVKMMQEGNVKYPSRDVDRRRALSLMLHLPLSSINRFTCEELEEIAIKRGYLRREE